MSKERPILFSGPMIRAILEGRKTQTRRILKTPEWYGCPTGDCYHKAQQECDEAMNEADVLADCPYGVTGDRLWVKHEHWKKPESDLCPLRIWDQFTEVTRSKDYGGEYEDRRESFESFSAGVDVKKCPSIHMPRWASRILLEVTGVRVERLEDISDKDCVAEGCAGGNGSIPNYGFSATPREHYRHVWESINGKGSWAANPWVWVVEFKHVVQAVTA